MYYYGGMSNGNVQKQDLCDNGCNQNLHHITAVLLKPATHPWLVIAAHSCHTPVLKNQDFADA